MVKRKIGEEVKFQEWHFGKIVDIEGKTATIQLTTGGRVLKDISELKTNKMLPKYIDFLFGKYRVRPKGVNIGMFETLEEALKARDDYFNRINK
jgi:hypothetical protein